MEVTPAMVKGLRERTGLGLMDCKRALQESDGDTEKAIVALRTAGLAKASAKSSREALEGLVSVAVGADGSHVMCEVNCETDFVARSDDFANFMKHYGDSLLACTDDGIDGIAGAAFATGGSIEEARCALVAKVGENVSLRRFVRISPEDGAKAEYYIHQGRIGVMVEIKGAADSSTLGREVAMHIAASQPRYIEPSQVPEAELEKERSILSAEAKQSGKPENIISKMVEGRLRKYCSEICLLQQPYVRDPEITVGQLLQKGGASVSRMLCYVLGGGDASGGGRAS